MAATYIPYQLQNTWQATAQTTAFTLNTNRRAAPRTPTDLPRDQLAEEARSLEIDIEELSTATLTIDQAFYNIGRRLSEVSEEQKECVDLYNICHTLQTLWDEHYLTYKDLIWRSREFSVAAQVAVDDFLENVLPSLRDRHRTRAEKQEIIQAQILVLQGRSQPSQQLCQDFLDFGRALDAYITDFSRDVAGLGTDEQNMKVSKLRDRLQSARGAMETVRNEVKAMGWKLVTDVATTGIAILLAFVVPTFWARLSDTVAINYSNVKHSFVQFREIWKQSDLAVAEYKATKASYELESACLAQMVKLETTLHDSVPLVREVTLKLGIFAGVWAAITADIRKLNISLQYMDDPASPLFDMRVERLERMYGYLSLALRHYQVTVQLPVLRRG